MANLCRIMLSDAQQGEATSHTGKLLLVSCKLYCTSCTGKLVTVMKLSVSRTFYHLFPSSVISSYIVHIYPVPI